MERKLGGVKTDISKCSFQNGLRDFLTVVDANFSTPSRETTTNGSGSRNRFRFGSPLALRTGGGKRMGLNTEVVGGLQASLTGNSHSSPHDFRAASGGE